MSFAKFSVRVIIILQFSLFLILSVKAQNTSKIDTTLSNELVQMGKTDQLAAANARPPKEFKHLSLKQWKAKKDSIYKTHKIRLEEILNTHGYPGWDLVGKRGDLYYWLMVQHCDFDPKFQQKVLDKLEIEVKNKNADPSHFGLLTDRVRVNTGRKQTYGTQVTYEQKTGQAKPKNLEDPENVNQRRALVGLEPIEVYLNDMTKLHFEMNKNYFKKKGITKPKLYEIKD